MLCKSPTKVMRRQARIEILEQLDVSGPVVTLEEEREEAQAVVDAATLACNEAVRAAYQTLHNAVAAMDPCLRRHVEWDRYDRFYWVRW